MQLTMYGLSGPIRARLRTVDTERERRRHCLVRGGQPKDSSRDGREVSFPPPIPFADIPVRQMHKSPSLGQSYITPICKARPARSVFGAMPRKKSKAKGRVPRPAPTAKDTPPYTFSFRPANGLRKKTIEKAKDLLPEDLCGILMDKQPNPPPPRRWHDSWWSMTMSSSWPQSSVSSDPSGEHVYDEQRNEMEYEVKEQFRGQEHQVGAEAKGRHHRELYVMQTNAEVDKSVEQVLSSAKVTKVFRQVNSIVGQEKKRRALVASICRLSTSVRSELGAAESGYGKFVRCKSLPIVDLEYPPMDLVNLDGHIMVQAAEVAGQPEWSNMVSFIVVKKTDAEDLNNKAVRQGLFYVRQMHQYRPITSHVHFATWCGHFVRLWYANATIYGCSRAFDTRTPNDRKDIVRILLFFSLREHSGQLSGYWNLVGQHSLEIEADVATDSALVKAQVTEHRVRPGPFGSRTAVFVEQDKTAEQDAGKRTLLVKVSWLYEHLRLHELTMLRGIQSLGLPYAPRPIGLAVIPTAGFQRTTSETTSSSVTQVELYEYTREYDSKSATRHRTVSALVTEQCLGDYIGMQVSMHDLLQIHVQVAEQLLRLAKGGYHYRDFNPGNVRLLRGTRNTLLFIDFGNMRTKLSPLQQSGMQMCDAEALAARAADDGQSANPIYLSTCCARALKDAWIWTLTLRHTSEDIYSDLRAGPGGTNVFGCRNKEPKQILRRIIDSLRKVFVKSHRYIDDLEGAVYLQFWQVSELWLERPAQACNEPLHHIRPTHLYFCCRLLRGGKGPRRLGKSWRKK
ncbi:hypothetical protein BCV69DRAFT_178371 [Microstroma glucosiphilum]|uniref:Fungal-type protein kinase domain-containing protein n=1 Tax=Pseudomicrostroma glucosiphilum TaxID=1684307 RepID=A0A316U8X6_9BASI|nr:hypothetical protein BCV69DRAFT_178371 [Pseudomicrostroma glucosiphilum]PWN20911.1 hypothetical protein BCV69DRAFT_178371 [Pseudomicrostroma glucosiphilum]